MNKDTGAPEGSADHESDLENGTSLVGWLYKQIDPPFESEQEFAEYCSNQVDRQSDLAKRARTLGISDDFNTYLKVCSEAGYDIDELGLCGAAEVASEQREKILSDRVAERMSDVHADKPKRLAKQKGETQDDRMRQAVDDDARRAAWDSNRWADFLDCRADRVRKLRMWRSLQGMKKAKHV